MLVIRIIRKLFGALLILAGLAVAAWGVWVCSYALDAEPYIDDAEGGPSAALEHFLSCMEQKDWAGAASDLYNYSSLGLEIPPEDELSRMYWDAQLAALHFTAAEGSEMSGTRMIKRVTVHSLNLDAISEDVGRRVQEILEEKVRNAYLKSDVYDETGAYKEEVAYDALHEATREVLSDTAPYAISQECTLILHFTDGRWRVELSPAFISALSAGAARG